VTFWSSQKHEEKFRKLTDHPDNDMVDCNALTLRVDPEAYVTLGLEQALPSKHTRQMLPERWPITVPRPIRLPADREADLDPARGDGLHLDRGDLQASPARQCLRLPCRPGLKRAVDLH
jgi:hypothetical protein